MAHDIIGQPSHCKWEVEQPPTMLAPSKPNSSWIWVEGDPQTLCQHIYLKVHGPTINNIIVDKIYDACHPYVGILCYFLFFIFCNWLFASLHIDISCYCKQHVTTSFMLILSMKIEKAIIDILSALTRWLKESKSIRCYACKSSNH